MGALEIRLRWQEAGTVHKRNSRVLGAVVGVGICRWDRIKRRRLVRVMVVESFGIGGETGPGSSARHVVTLGSSSRNEWKSGCIADSLEESA